MADLATQYRDALKSTRALEEQGLQQMKSQVSSLGDYPRYQAVLTQHIPVTEKQIGRLDTALSEVDESASGLKEAVTKMAGTVGAAVHGLAGDAVLKNLFAGYAFQYDQIAAYRSLIVYAKAAGRDASVKAFEMTIQEENEAAHAIDEIIEVVTTRYIEMSTKAS